MCNRSQLARQAECIAIVGFAAKISQCDLKILSPTASSVSVCLKKAPSYNQSMKTLRRSFLGLAMGLIVGIFPNLCSGQIVMNGSFEHRLEGWVVSNSVATS